MEEKQEEKEKGGAEDPQTNPEADLAMTYQRYYFISLGI